MKNKIKEDNILTCLLFFMSVLSLIGLVFSDRNIIYGILLFMLGIMWGLRE